MVFCKRMPTGQNPVQPTTQAAKYYKSLSLLFLLPFLLRERLVASPGLYGNRQFHVPFWSMIYVALKFTLPIFDSPSISEYSFCNQMLVFFPIGVGKLEEYSLHNGTFADLYPYQSVSIIICVKLQSAL